MTLRSAIPRGYPQHKHKPILDIREPDGMKNKVIIRWISLHERVTNRNFYKDCTISESWKYYSNFKSWIQEELSLWNGVYSFSDLQLDKDLLSPMSDNKIYSEETCILIPQELNKFTTFLKKGYEFDKIGGHLDKRDGFYYCHCNNPFTKKSQTHGRFSSQEDAHMKWREVKAGHCQDLADAGVYNRPQVSEILMEIKDKLLNI